MNPSLAPRCRTGELDASIEIAPSHGFRGFVVDANRRRCCHRRQASSLRFRISTRLDSSRLRSSGDDHSRSVPYRLDTPTSSAVARRRRQLVSASDDVIAFDPIWKRPVDVGFGWNPAATLPSRRDPPRPCQTRDSGYLRNEACRLALHRNTVDSRRCTTETPKGLPGARNLTRIIAEDPTSAWTPGAPSVLPHSLRNSMLAGRRRNRTLPDCGLCEPKLTLPALLLRPAASTQAPTPTVATRIADWTRPNTHMKSKPMMLPPSPRQELRTRRWECAELHHKLGTSNHGSPRGVAPQRSSVRRLQQAGANVSRPPSSINVLPTLLNPLTLGSSAAMGYDDVTTAAGFPRVWRPGHEGLDLPYNSYERCLSPQHFRPIPSKTGGGRPNTSSTLSFPHHTSDRSSEEARPSAR